MKRALSLLLAAAQLLPAQAFLRWYETPVIPEARSANTARLAPLIRAGQLRLTLADAIALAIENNLNLEAARYGPLLSEWGLKRAEAGGPVRGVPSASAQVSSVNSGVGVNGSTDSAGLGGGGNGGGGGNSGSASIQQIGAITPNLDPILQNTSTFSHQSEPLANTNLQHDVPRGVAQRRLRPTHQLPAVPDRERPHQCPQSGRRTTRRFRAPP